MGKRHNTLSDEIFKNSKYIYTLEQALGIDDFKKECKNNKEYKGQYDMMLDVFKTLITINNVLFSDSNKNIKEKQDEIYDILFKIVYKNEDSERLKYGLRLQKGLKDSHTRYLYKKFIDWCNNFYTYSFDNIKKQVEEEMTQLENVGFDNVMKKDVEYKKNKDSKYKIYICKLDYLCQNQNKEIETYVKNFYDIFGIELSQREKDEMYSIYKLVAYANNGIVKLLFKDNIQKFNLTERSNDEDYFNAYLKSLNIEIKDNDLFMANAEFFNAEFLNLNNSIIELLENDNNNTHIEEIGLLNVDIFISNYDLYFFYINMEKMISYDFQFTTNANILLKIYNDLKDIFYLLYDNVPTIKNENQVKEAYDKIQAIIERNKNLFERVS